MLTGRPPFKGSSVLETLHQVVTTTRCRRRGSSPGSPRDLETICLKCLQKEPPKRYATALELADDLRRYLDDRPIRARRTPLWERGAKWVRRHPTTATLLGLGTAAAVTLVVACARSRRPAQGRRRREDARAAAQRRERTVLDEAQTRLLEKDWADGRFILSNLLTDLKAEPRLDDIRGRAERLLEQAERGLRDEADQRRDRERQRDFLRAPQRGVLPRDPVHRPRPAGGRAGDPRGGARGAGRLRRAPARAMPGPSRRCRATLSPQEQAEIEDGCYELLLVLAEAVAEPLPGEDPVLQADRGLRILDQASGLRAEPTPT